jgi:hypothetical protein
MDYHATNITNIFSLFDKWKYGPPPFDGRCWQSLSVGDRGVGDVGGGGGGYGLKWPLPWQCLPTGMNRFQVSVKSSYVCIQYIHSIGYCTAVGNAVTQVMCS